MDSKEYCNCENINGYDISLSVIPIHKICGKEVRVKFPEIRVETNSNKTNERSAHDFKYSNKGYVIINLYYYLGVPITEISKQMGESEERITVFLNTLSQDEDMKNKYQYSLIQKRQYQGHRVNSFIARSALSSNEDDYGNIPKNNLRLGWVCPEEL